MPTFLQQFEILRQKNPRIGLQCVNNVNSPFCQYTENSKNCYMTFASYQSENCYYNTRVFYCTDCADCTLCYKCELCYESIDCINSYNCNYCDHCEDCVESEYCYYSVGLKNCFGCINLRHKQYYIFNKEYSPEEYQKQIDEIKKLTPTQIYEKITPHLLKFPKIYMYGKNTENSYGDNLHNSKNAYWAFDSKNLHDCLYSYHCDDSKNLNDCSHLGWSELCYEIMSGGNLNNCMFCYGSWHSNDLMYCDSVYSSHDCLLCTGLNHAEYCILNIPYSKEEYFKKVEEIKQQMVADNEWGKWFESTYPEVITYGL